jgi:hypothetical protein
MVVASYYTILFSFSVESLFVGGLELMQRSQDCEDWAGIWLIPFQHFTLTLFNAVYLGIGRKSPIRLALRFAHWTMESRRKQVLMDHHYHYIATTNQRHHL